MILQRSAERRKHVVYVTRHSEYHCRDRECVGVRDRHTGAWKTQHSAVRGRLVGATDGGGVVWDQPQIGERLLFMGDDSVLTSRIVGSGRPPKDAVWCYTSFVKAGHIVQ